MIGDGLRGRRSFIFVVGRRMRVQMMIIRRFRCLIFCACEKFRVLLLLCEICLWIYELFIVVYYVLIFHTRVTMMTLVVLIALGLPLLVSEIHESVTTVCKRGLFSVIFRDLVDNFSDRRLMVL